MTRTRKHTVAPRYFIALCAFAGAFAPGFASAQDEGTGEDEDEIVVQATRSNRRVQDEPIRVEVIGREEIEEKILMTPGNISMLVAETGGVRVQVTSPALGAANVRMQGMSGRYTSILADGLPLYGGQAIGLLQIPPTDLGQVEVIKGAASALHGSSALGGVINLVSRRPGDGPLFESLLNATTRDGQDVTLFASAPLNERWGYSAVGGYHRQSVQDLDSDGWADAPDYERWTTRPRFFFEGANGATAFLTLGAMTEERTGGTLPGRTAPDGQPFVQAQEATRFDGGAVAELPLSEDVTLHLRGAAVTQDHAHRYGAIVEDDRHDTAFVEASAGGDVGHTNWIAGIAYQRDAYRAEDFPVFDYTFEVPGAFAQVEHDVTDDLTLAGSARVDWHSEYGKQLSPRLSALYRPGAWTVRASLGEGYFAPTPFVEDIEAAGLSRLAPLGALEPETAHTASLDVGYRAGGLETNVTLFASDLHNAVRLEDTSPASVRLVNVDGLTRTRGTELLLRYRWESFVVTGSYVFVDATEPDRLGGRRRVATTPRHTAGFVAMWEEHDRGRVGFEAYYSGEQTLEDNPYRTRSEGYFELGLLGEMVIGNARVFLNLENLLDVRQSDYDSLLLPARAADGRWTVDAWAPLDGFVANAGVKLRFGNS